jgi:hypothetical protein
MRFTSTTFVIAFLAPVLSGGQRAPSMSANAGMLDAYIDCSYSNGLSVRSLIRLPGEGVRYRTVETAKGKRKVSVIDGYRLIVWQGEPSYFANMKVEKSDPRQYASDKEAVTSQLEVLKQSSITGKHVLDHMPYNGFDVYGLMDPTMDDNGPNGVYLLFHDPTQTIVTIYFLGQKPEYRKFKTIEEHDALVDRMLEELVTCATTPPPAGSVGNLPRLRTGEDFRAFVENYYLQPRPDRIPDLIRMLSSSEALVHALGAVRGFFSEVFAANPQRLAEWVEIINSEPADTRLALDGALTWSNTGGVLQLQERVPQMNDVYWGAFFASGNPQYVKKILGLVPLAAERRDFDLWQTGANAKWSLATKARQHALVRSILEGEKLTADKRTQDTIGELLERDPDRIRQEMAGIYARQKRLGRWK